MDSNYANILKLIEERNSKKAMQKTEETQVKAEAIEDISKSTLTPEIYKEKKSHFDSLFREYFSEAFCKELGKNADVITMDTKMKENKPYNVFFNTIKMSPETSKQTNSINFTDLLCSSFGELKSSLQINYMVDILWLLEQYAQRNLQKKPLTILYGYKWFPWPEKEVMREMFPNIDHHFVNVPDDNGCHHSKLGIYAYEDGSIRVVISTANLYTEDWTNYNQQLWISPPCPKLPKSSSPIKGESPTKFKSALQDYLYAYKLPCLRKWMDCVKNADFSDIKVALVYSIPGVHFPRNNGSHSHYVGELLYRHCTIPPEEQDSWDIVAHTSSLGFMGETPQDWLYGFCLKSLGSHKEAPFLPSNNFKANFSLVYPSIQNCLDGYLGPDSANCCNYDKAVREKQPWLEEYMCQWKSYKLHRSQAMSHSKSYLRLSPCKKKIAYYLLTSANLSRSAWGGMPKKGGSTYLRSYELGVLFLPKFFAEEFFRIVDGSDRKKFPLIFDMPLTPYGPEDESYCREVLEQRGCYSHTDESGEDGNSEAGSLKDKLTVLIDQLRVAQEITLYKELIKLHLHPQMSGPFARKLLKPERISIVVNFSVVV